MEKPFLKSDILDYKTAFRAGPELVGGKAWAVSRLSRYGFRVPAGCVLSTVAYEKFLKHSGIYHHFFDEDGGKTAAVSIEKASALYKAIVNASFPDCLKSLISEKFAEYNLKGPMAVRSSAIGEDGEENALSGIYETRLNVEGEDAICQSIKEIWASLWTPAALAYRSRKSVREKVSCGVLFNQMVPHTSTSSFSAGVAFTCDPVTGRRDIVVLNATTGWADKLVNGSVNVEQWRIDLRKHPMKAIRDVTLPSGEILSCNQSVKLAQVAQRILWAFGDGQNPMDIEWVICGEDIWIVQARPVTHCQAPRLPGERHLPRVWSNANIVESMPGVLRTISWEIVKMNLDQILHATHRLGGYDIPDGLEPARRFEGRIFLDQTQLQYISHDAYAIPLSEFNRMLGGHQGEIELPVNKIGKRFLCMLRGVRLIRRARPYQKDFTIRCAEIRQWLKDHAHKDWRSMDKTGLATALRQMIDKILRFGLDYALSSINGDSAILTKFLEKSFKDESRSISAGLMAGTGEILSAEQSFRIDALARAALKSPAAKHFLLTTSENKCWQTLPADDPFKMGLDVFLEDFGHRSVYEGEVANARWVENPDYIIDQVRSLVKNDMGESPKATATRIQERSIARLMQLSVLKRRIAFKLLKKARESVARREAGKSTFSCHILPLRAILLEIGRRLVENTCISQVDDVFDLTTVDILAYLDGKWRGEGADALVADRKSKRLSWMAETVPNVIIDGEYEKCASIPKCSGQKATSGFQGIAASPGIAEGRVKIIHHPNEANGLCQGDILVTSAMDAGWTPLLLRVGAVVAEVGGFLSHGAIVAREFGLPAVFNIPGLLENIEDEQMVRVDGNRGEVVILQ